tara:strand:+ start:1585 stop:2475 length:891 start_codon:yes stop_codon:yes gene_type:complete
MATGITLSSTSNLSSGQKIFIEQAMLANEPAAPNPDLVGNERIETGVKQWDINTYARLESAGALSEGVDLSEVQQLTTANLSITPSEHGIIVTLSNRLIRRQGDSSVVGVAGEQAGASLRRRMDLDVIALFDGFSKSVVGATNQLDITHFRGAIAYLLTDNDESYGPAPLPLNASLHIEQISDIILDLSDPGTAAGSRPAGFGDELLQNWWKGRDRLYGIGIFHGGNITRDSADDSKGAILATNALYLVIANDADVTEETDNSLRAVEYGAFQEWGEAERADPHGVEVYSDTEATV